MARIKNKNCNPPVKYVCTTQIQDDSCEDRRLTASNTEHSTGYSNITIITPEVNQISAYKEHLEFVNSPKPLSGIKNHVVLRLAESFINTIANIFRGTNVGTGTDIYKGPRTVGTDTFHDFKRLKDSESINFQGGTNDIIAVVDPDWLEDQFPEIPTVDYPVISGENVKTDPSAIGVYKILQDKKIQLKSLVSSDIIITDEGNDIKLSLPGGGSTSNFYYLDPSYIRPVTWGDPVLNPKEEILNTDIHPTLKKIPTGRLNDPFIDYTEFLLFAVGNAADSNSYGNYTTANPKNSGVLQILSSVITHQKIEVNAWNVYLNKANLVHSGTETYSLDMRRLWSSENFDPITGKIKRPIGFILGGEGELSRTLGLGLIYSKGDVNKTTAELSYNFTFLPTGLGIRIVEARNPFPDTNPNVRLTRADGTTLLSNGNYPIFGRVQKPNTPLIVIDNSTFGFWGAIVEGAKLFIVASTQSHIKFINGGNLSSSSEQIMYQVENSVVGYERKMIENAPGNTVDENLFLATKKVGAEVGFFYKPFEGYNVFDIDDGHFRVENLSTQPNGFLHAAANAVVNIKGVNSAFNNLVSWRDTGGGAALNLIQVIGTPGFIKTTNLDLVSSVDVFVKGDGINTANIVMSNTKINGIRKITEDVPNLNIYTEGTLCSIQGKSIITLVNYANNDDALDDGLIKDMLYRNNTTGVITQVI